MRYYIPDPILEDCERSAKWRLDHKVKGHKDHMGVTVHANVLIALIGTYREAREQHLQKSEQK